MFKEHKVLLVFKVLKEKLVPKVLKEHKVLLEYKVPKVLPEHKEHKA